MNIIYLIIIIIIIVLLKVLNEYLEKNEIYKYKLIKSPMTKTELIFYKELRKITQKYNLEIIPQIQMQKVFKTYNKNDIVKVNIKLIKKYKVKLIKKFNIVLPETVRKQITVSGIIFYLFSTLNFF